MITRPTQEQLMEIVAPFQDGALEDALAKAQALDKLFPDFPITQNLTGLILAKMGRLVDALAPLRAAVAQRPDYAEAQNNLGVVLGDLGRLKEAATHYLAAIEQNPNYAEALNNLGCLMKDMNRSKDAIALLDRAIALMPDYVEAISNKGDVLLHLGDYDAAAKELRRAIDLSPNFAPTHRNLSVCQKYTADNPHIQEMETLWSSDALDPTGKGSLGFALGKAYDDMADYDRAFDYFEKANAVLDAHTPYSPVADQRLFQSLKATFGQSVPELRIPTASPRPVFIVGMPRSGTSLTEQILASHSQVHGAGELDLLENVLQRARIFEQPMSEPLLREIRAGYLGGIGDIETDAPIVTDKLPLNFRWIGFILKALPEAKIIHCSRDARAVCWSIFRHGFATTGNSYQHSMANIAQYYHMYQDLMAFWHERFPGRILDMDYEHLTQNQKRQTERLLEFTGVDWEDGCLEFHKNKRAVMTVSSTQVRRAMYQGSSEAWRNYEAHLGPLLDGLGARR